MVRNTVSQTCTNRVFRATLKTVPVCGPQGLELCMSCEKKHTTTSLLFKYSRYCRAKHVQYNTVQHNSMVSLKVLHIVHPWPIPCMAQNAINAISNAFHYRICNCMKAPHFFHNVFP
ncbi:hypothetical protein FKM82_021158 [Ascaphus truei]